MNCHKSAQMAVLETPPEGQELSGFPAQSEPSWIVPESEAWITPELIADTRRVWSKRYGRPITQEEAVDILVNVKNVAVAFLRITKGDEE